MAFQLKDFVSIAASMVNYAKATQGKITDFRVGSVARTLMEAPAIEIEELYQRIFAGIMEAIPVSVYRTFGFNPLPATAARVTLTLNFGLPLQDPITIPQGSIFLDPASGLRYSSSVTVNVPAGATTAYVPVVCTQTGSIGNVPTGSINQALNITLPNQTVIEHPPVTSGSDGESESERQARFASFIQSLSRGTVASVLFAAAGAQITDANGNVIEYVTRANIREFPGRFEVYLYGSGGIASDALIAKAQAILDGYEKPDGTKVPGYRAAGIQGDVIAMHETHVDMTIDVVMFPGFSLDQSTQDAIRSAVSLQFDQVSSGGILYMSAITDAVLSVSGVHKAWVENQENIPSDVDEVLQLGNLAIKVLADASA